MKNLFLLFSCFLLTSFSFAQTIRRVTNLPVTNLGVNVYPTVADAITAAVDGDIIYIEPSENTYANFTVNKRLQLIGNGNFLDENPNTPYEKSESYITGQINFAAGSTGSSVTGLFILSGIAITAADNIKIRRNRIGDDIILGPNTEGHLIAENFIEASLGATLSDATSGQSLLIRNNIIRGQVLNLKNSTIQNNTFTFNPTYGIVYKCVNGVISNNIFDRRSVSYFRDVFVDNNGSSVAYNLEIISASAVIPSPNPDAFNNKYTSAVSSVFVVPNPWTGVTTDGNFKLAAGSPAAGAGVGGIDVGAYGGQFPYTLSILPNIPIITTSISTTSGTNTVPISVTISVRSN